MAAESKETYTPVEETDYGYVVVMHGKHKGKTGYYDDDAGSTRAIVYFDNWNDGYVYISRAYLRKANDLEAMRHKKAKPLFPSPQGR